MPLKTKMIEALTLPSATFRMPSTRWATWGVLAEASERAHPAGLDLVYQTFSDPPKGELPLSARSILLAVSSSCSDALDGSVFASLPFDRETIEWLSLRAQCFLKAKEAYPDLYETYEFDSRLQWYDTSTEKEYADQADRDKLARLTDDLEPLDDDRRAELDKLDSFA